MTRLEELRAMLYADHPEFETEELFDIWKAEQIAIEEANIIEIAAQSDLRSRWEVMVQSDGGMPWFRTLYPDIANYAVWFRDVLPDKDNREALVSAIEAEKEAYYNNPAYKLEQFNLARQAEYIKEGATIEAMIVALWEKEMEGRPEAAAALETKRAPIKVKIPKP